MASSSCCSSQVKHDVFLSFRGKDTRDNFVSHLHAALSQKKIETFIDSELNRGNEIAGSLLNAIEGSKILVIIFSKGYASSRWCLEELVKILECRKKYGQLVIPVFYRIDPSHVRNQTGTFAKALTKHEEQLRKSSEKVQKWKVALTEAANLSGFDSNVIRPESLLIENIIKDILKKLNDMSEVDNKDLIGIDSSIKWIVQLLHMELMGIRKIGIWGIGGIGKTTLARAVFNKVFKHFEDFFFAQDIKEASKTYNEFTHLREELLFTILEDRHANIKLQFTKERLSRKKVFIVFDDVTCVNQIEELIGDLEYLGSGSRVIITTRDKQVLRNCGVDRIIEVGGLRYEDALQLFSRYAFKQNHLVKDYMQLSTRVVRYAKGIPLALKVLGSFLFGRSKEHWKEAINKLQIIPNMDIQKVLKVSYDELNDEDKNSFLHIACFFRGWNRNLVEEILDACGFYPRFGIDVLIERSLIIISFETITMHDLVQEMGREIVRQESTNDPGKRSRLWHHDDIYHVLKQNMGTESIQGISLDISKIEEINLDPHAFTKMRNLRFFEVYSSLHEMNNKMHGFENLESDFGELRCFYWYKYPFKSLPPHFHATNLVALDISHSNVEQLWNGVQDFIKLKYINICHCMNLLKIPDFSQDSNLEDLNLQCCIAIKELPSSVGRLSRLKVLNLENCSRLESLPNAICQLKSLKSLHLSGCSKLERLPNDFGSLEALEVLEANGTAIREVPPSVVRLNNLQELSLQRCKVQESIGLQLPTFSGLCYLKKLSLSDCSITELPSSLDQLCSLEYLDVARNNFTCIPTSIVNLSKLSKFIFSNCNMLQSLPQLPCCLRDVQAEGCTSLQAVSSLMPSVIWELPLDTNLSFINCLKVDWNSLGNLLNDAVLNFEQNKTLLLEAFKSRYLYLAVGISFPGSEIPDCFSIQSSGCFMVLPPGSINHNFMGLIFCTVLAFQDFHCDCRLEVYYKFYVELEDGTFILINSDLCSVWKGDIAPIHIEMDHVVVGYDGRMRTPEMQNLAFNRKIIVHFGVGSSSTAAERCKVKKCGVCLLYNQDRGKSMGESSGYFISSEEEGEDEDEEEEEDEDEDEEEEEEQGEPYSKRFKCSTAVEGEPCASYFISDKEEEKIKQQIQSFESLYRSTLLAEGITIKPYWELSQRPEAFEDLWD